MKIWMFIRKNTVLCAAFCAAAITSILVPPDAGWLDYFDLRTLTCLFLTLAVVCALRNIHFFSILALRGGRRTGKLRALALARVYITFIGSMLIANDMALITFLPLGYFSLKATNNQKHMAYVFILQNISANLGGMLTPFGNPQNLYLYSYFEIPTGEFVSILFPPFLLAVLMLTVFCLLLPAEKLELRESFLEKLDGRRAAFYLVLFALSIAIVFRLLPYWVGLILIPAAPPPVDRHAPRLADYALLGTLRLFRNFAGNLSRLDVVNRFVSGLLERNTLLVSVLSCQCISNVPTAILLSRFTENYPALLLGVNIGGTGTLIASLASLITFREYQSCCPGQTRHYLLCFALLNFIFLAVLTAAAQFLFL